MVMTLAHWESTGVSVGENAVLVLNASYEPINICGARRALVLVLKGVASAEEESTHAIHSARAALRTLPTQQTIIFERAVQALHPWTIVPEHADFAG